MKDDYQRSTRLVSAGELPPALKDSLLRAAADAGVMDLDHASLHLVETHARRARAAGFIARLLGADPDVEHWCAVAVTSTAVIVGTFGASRGTWARALQLSTLDLETLPTAVAGELAGRTVVLASPTLATYESGRAVATRGTFAVVLASAPDAEALRAAVQRAKSQGLDP